MIRSGPREIGDGVVRLREVTRKDTRRLYEWRMDPSTRRMYRRNQVIPHEQYSEIVKEYFQPGNDDRWFVIETADGPVGALAIHSRDADGRAKWGRLVVEPRARGRGYARRALDLLLADSRRLGLRELSCQVLADNVGARGLYRAAGFVEGESEWVGRREFIECTLTLRDTTVSASAE